VILLDTNAAIWLLQHHRRARPLLNLPRVYFSPASLLELQFLAELGRLGVSSRASVASLADDPRWYFDEPPSGKWFTTALEMTWTRDPFDRLLVAHARMRGWKLATGDHVLLGHLGTGESLALT
jgi:PIN domain nuclease of toxin-antitoxin system